MRLAVMPLLVLTAIVGCAGVPDEQGLKRPSSEQGAQAIIGTQRSAAAYSEAVLVQVNNPASDYCSGVLVAPQVVLTAAHCIIFNVNGTWTITAPFASGGSQVRAALSGEPMDAASYSLTYANYDQHPELHDLGLIYLSSPFTGISYPTLTATRYPIGATHPAVSAVGRDSVSPSAGLVLSAQKPLSTTSSGFTFDNNTPRITDGGDSGGPLFLEGTHTLVGTETRFSGGGANAIDYWARLDDSADSMVYTFISNRVASHGGWYATLSAFRDEVSNALCARVSSCCNAASPGYTLSSSKCHAIYDQFGFEATARGIQTANAANVSINGSVKDACIQKITNNAADCSITSVEVKAAITDCLGAVVGLLPAGAACTSSLECAGANACIQDAAGSGTCQALRAVGQSCEVLYKTGSDVFKRDNLAQDLCSKRGGGQSGLFCDAYDPVLGVHRDESTWTCKTAHGAGGACNTDTYCSSFVCDPATFTCAANASFVNTNVCTAFAGP
jgi:hypothetical protein